MRLSAASGALALAQLVVMIGGSPAYDEVQCHDENTRAADASRAPSGEFTKKIPLDSIPQWQAPNAAAVLKQRIVELIEIDEIYEIDLRPPPELTKTAQVGSHEEAACAAHTVFALQWDFSPAGRWGARASSGGRAPLCCCS